MNATEDREEPIPEPTPVSYFDPQVAMLRCKRCNLLYMGNKSTSALRLTYCSFLCELGDLGFSISGLEHMELVKKDAAPDPDRDPLLEPSAAIV